MKRSMLKRGIIPVIIIILCLFFSQMLTGCDVKSSSQSAISEEQEPGVSYTSDSDTDTNATSQSTFVTQETVVPAKLQLYEKEYFDNHATADYPWLTPSDYYYAVSISNITPTSFDFTVLHKQRSTREFFDESTKTFYGEGTIITVIPLTTAYFTGNGTWAVAQYDNTELLFAFPDLHNSHPVVTDIKIFGLKSIESVSFLNNTIDGYEFSHT